MTNVGKVLLGATMLGGAYLAYRYTKRPSNDVPAGNGSDVPIPATPTADNPHPATSIAIFSLPQLEEATHTDDLSMYARTPLRSLPVGATTLVAMSWEGVGGPGWWPVPMSIVDDDPDAAKGHVVARVGDNFAVAGGPAAGTQISLSTATDDDVANLDPGAPNLDAFLQGHGF